MSGLYWTDGSARVLDYGANIKGAEAVVTIKIKVIDLDDLPHLIRQLEAGKAPKLPRRGKPSPPLMLTDERDRS